MILIIAYLFMGVLVGFLIKSEVEVRSRRKRIQQRMGYLKSTASKNNIEKYDDILESLRSINDSLASLNNQNKKEVR